MQLPCHFIFISSHGSDFHFRFHSPRRVMEQAQTEFYASDAKLGCPGPRLPQEASGCSQRMYLHVLSERCQSSDRRQTSQCGFSSSFLRRQSCAWAFSLELSFGHLSCLAYLRIRLHSDPASPHYLCLPLCFQPCLGLHTTEVHTSPTHASSPFSLHL